MVRRRPRWACDANGQKFAPAPPGVHPGCTNPASARPHGDLKATVPAVRPRHLQCVGSSSGRGGATPAVRTLAGLVSCWLSAVFLAGVADADTSSVEPARDRRGAKSDSDRIVGVPFVRTHGTGEVGPVRCARHVVGICQLSCWHVLLTLVCDAPSRSRRSNAPGFLPDWRERRSEDRYRGR